MILVDANLLLYAKVSDFQQHQRAKSWLDDALSGATRVGIPWESMLAFARIITNPRVFSSPLGIEPAWKQVEEWRGLPSVWTPLPTPRHGEILEELVRTTRPSSQLLPDAHLAALAIEHGLVLCSADSDFARFPSLRWQNPLAEE